MRTSELQPIEEESSRSEITGRASRQRCEVMHSDIWMVQTEGYVKCCYKNPGKRKSVLSPAFKEIMQNAQGQWFPILGAINQSSLRTAQNDYCCTKEFFSFVLFYCLVSCKILESLTSLSRAGIVWFWRTCQKKSWSQSLHHLNQICIWSSGPWRSHDAFFKIFSGWTFPSNEWPPESLLIFLPRWFPILHVCLCVTRLSNGWCE